MPADNVSPGISIIMPTYNRAAFIIETIQTVIDQTYQDWELIIVDDQSTDNTGELIANIKDERIHYYKTTARLKITGTRNFGLQKAGNELIAFIDSDDLWANTKLEKQVTILKQHADVGFCLTGGFNFKRSANQNIAPGYPGEPIDFFYKQRSGTRIDNLLIPYFKSELSTTTSSLIFRKKCLDTIGFFNEEKPFAEVDLILNLARHFKGVILYEPLLYRRIHDSNISNATWEKGYEEGIILIRSYRKIIPLQVMRDAFFRLYINYGEDCLLRKKNGNAINCFFNAWKYQPFSIIPFKKSFKAMLRYFKK